MPPKPKPEVGFSSINSFTILYIPSKSQNSRQILTFHQIQGIFEAVKGSFQTQGIFKVFKESKAGRNPEYSLKPSIQFLTRSWSHFTPFGVTLFYPCLERLQDFLLFIFISQFFFVIFITKKIAMKNLKNDGANPLSLQQIVSE